MPPHLHIDFETFSEADLKEVGAYRYAFDPSTEILCAGVALGDEEPFCWYRCPECGGVGHHETGGFDAPLRFSVPCSCSQEVNQFEKYLDALENPEVLIYAFNASFEIAISSALMERTWGIQPPAIERWRCARSIGLRAALPGSLDKLGEVLGLTTQKDNRGKALIKKFSMLQKAKKATKKSPAVPEHRIYPQDDPTAFAEFLEYCKTDVKVEREAVNRLSYFDDPINNKNFTLHAVINHRGVAVNLDALRHAQELIVEETHIVEKAFRELVGFEVTQGKVFLGWLHSQWWDLPDLQAETIEAFLEKWESKYVECSKCNSTGATNTEEDIEVEGILSCPACGGTSEVPIAAQALRMKQSVAYASIKKVATMIACAGPHDNRIRGMLNHHGATTGRSTNSLVQFQNMKRPAGHLAKEARKGISWSEIAYQAICDGISREEMEICFGPVLEVISSCIRHFVQDA